MSSPYRRLVTDISTAISVLPRPRGRISNRESSKTDYLRLQLRRAGRVIICATIFCPLTLFNSTRFHGLVTYSWSSRYRGLVDDHFFSRYNKLEHEFRVPSGCLKEASVTVFALRANQGTRVNVTDRHNSDPKAYVQIQSRTSSG